MTDMIDTSHAQWNNYSFKAGVKICSSSGNIKYILLDDKEYCDVSGTDTGAGKVAASGYKLIEVSKGDYVSAYFKATDGTGRDGHETSITGHLITQ